MRLVLLIIIAAIVCQLIGAQLHVLGFAIIGLIITAPLVQSATLLGVAIIGYFIFGESLSRWRKIAIAVLIVAMTVLSIGKALVAEPQDESTVSAGLFLLVALGTIVAGIAYSVYIVMMRYVMRQHWKDDNSARLSFKFRHWIGHDRNPVKLPGQPGEKFYAPFPVTLAMVIVLAVGMVIFGTILYSKQGVAGFYTAPDFAWRFMLISGVCNLLGFFFQLQGLRMTSAVQASLIAVSQILLLSLVGYWFFAEAINVIVMIGLGLTVYGVFMSAKPERR
jgi:drug/metabolite transporter (DMT)-like permease